MSLFDYPRINFTGTFQVNPGTANNDDYVTSLYMPAQWGPFSGAPMGLLNSKAVEAKTFGMSDQNFIDWVQKPSVFNDRSGNPSPPAQFPAEWNYYGDMRTTGKATVVGVQTGPGEVLDTVGDDPLSGLIGQSLSFDGCMTDINPEGSPPATQFFIDQLSLGDKTLSGQPSKGVGQWINFYRNVNLTQDAGSGSYVYHVMKSDQLGIEAFQDPKIVGVILRYYLLRPLLDNPNADIEELYKDHQKNPKTLEVVGTLAPLYEGEEILTTPTGRLLVQNSLNLPTPSGTRNNGMGGPIALAPAVLQHQGDRVVADFIGTFPDNYDAQSGENPKYNFGAVTLVVSDGTNSAEVGAVEYVDTNVGNEKGWIFEFDLPAEAQKLLETGGSFQLVSESPTFAGIVLAETDYFFVSNQWAVYGEQHGSRVEFLNQGTPEPIRVRVFQRGQEISAEELAQNGRAMTVWRYRANPMQSPGDGMVNSNDYKPGEPIRCDVSLPGNQFFTFSINGPNNPPPAGYPPLSYNSFLNPPFTTLTNTPQISLWVLPNEEDFSRFYEDPDCEDPTGNEDLTFAVVFEKVLKTYYLLYPIMNVQGFPLNQECEVAKHAQNILDVTEMKNWLTTTYMPRTRDLSESRRKLLRAWCKKYENCP